MRTPFTELVGCTLPIQQAPIGFAAAEPALPIAVAEAGGHGMLAAVRMPPAALAERLEDLNRSTRAYGVNFIAPILDPQALEVAAAEAPLVELYADEPTPELVIRAKSGGALASWQVTSAEEARAAAASGCDLVVARGIEAGGRVTHAIGLLPLLDEVLEAVDVPVVAAGGIATGRGLAAVLAAGAAGARLGTAFLVAEEAATHPVHAEAVLAASAHDTVVTEAFSADAPAMAARMVGSALDAAERIDGEWAGEMTVFGERKRVPRFGADNPSADAAGNVGAMALYAGESAGAVRERRPAGEIVAGLVEEAGRLLGRAGSLP